MKRLFLGTVLLSAGYVLVACGSAGGGSGGYGEAVCGDGKRTGTEICEGNDFGQTTCASLGYTGGTPTCTDKCILDSTTCCNDSCVNLGDSTCAQDVVQTCQMVDGCRVYAPIIDCAQSGQQCGITGGQAKCNAGCVDACPTLGATQCNAGVIETCQAGTDGCRDWVATEDCTQKSQSCDATSGTAMCTGTCTNQCSIDGATQCSGNVLQTCTQGNDGCFTLTTTQDCASSNQSCKVVSGTASCVSACNDKCNTVNTEICAGNVRQTCTADTSGCLDWVNTEDCATKQQYCKLAGGGKTKCEGVCTNPCPTVNEKKCNANAIEECKLGINGCQEWQATTTCPLGQACQVSGSTYSCVTAPATGEDCGTVLPVKAGKNTVNWTAAKNDYLTTPPSCGLGYSISGPDVVLVYQSSFTGNVEWTLDKAASNRVDVVVASGTCGSMAGQLDCKSDYTYTSMGGNFNVSSGSNYFFYVADTTSGTAALDNPLVLTLAEIDCTTFKASAVTLDPANGGTTTTLAPKLTVDFDVAVNTTAGTVKLTGNKGTNETYTVGSSTQLTFSNSNKTLTINPGKSLPAGEVITVSIDGMTDSKCNSSINKPTWSFTVITPPCSPGNGGMLAGTKTLMGSAGVFSYYVAADNVANGYVYFGTSSAIYRVNKTSLSFSSSLGPDSTRLGYDMMMDGATPFSIDNTLPSSSAGGVLYKLNTSDWSTQDYMTFPSTPAPTYYVHSGATYKGKMYLITAVSSTSTATQIWSVPAGLATPNNGATLEASITGESYCTGLAVDDKYFYAACGTNERLIRIDRTTKAVTLLTNAFDLYGSTTYSNGLQAHDANNDGTADFLYFKGAHPEIYYVCNPAGATPYADTLVTYGTATSTSSYNGLAFDATNKTLYAIDNVSPYQLYSIK